MTIRVQRAWLRLALLAPLPLLAVAMISYAVSHPPAYQLLGVSSDGERVIYIEAKYSRRLRDVDSVGPVGYELFVREGDRRKSIPVTMLLSDSAALSFDQRLLAVGNPDGQITIYDAESLEALSSGDVFTPPFAARYLAFSRNNRYLMILGESADDRSWRYLVVDATTLAVTQEFGPNEIIRASGGRPYRVTHHPYDPSQTPFYGPGQIMEFEQGRLEPIAEAPEHPATEYSASLRFAVDMQASPLFRLLDREQGTSDKFKIPESRYPIFSPNSDQLVVLSGSELVSVVDPETAEVVRSWNLDGKRYGSAALSPQHSWIAITTAAGEIEVWDYAAGVRKYKISDVVRVNRMRWAVAVPGAILWCGGWLAIGWRNPSTSTVLRDIGVVSAVAAGCFFVVLLYHGYPILIWRYSAVGSVMVLMGASALLTVWLVFGPQRWSQRLSVALVGLAAIWAGPLWVWEHFELPYQPVPIIALLVIGLLASLLLYMRRKRWAIVWLSAAGDDTARIDGANSRHPMQVPLCDLLVFPIAVGVLLLVGKMVRLPGNVDRWWIMMFAMLIPFSVLLIAVAMWAALSNRGTISRWTIGLGGIVLLSITVGFILGEMARWWSPHIRWWVVSQATTALYVFFCLSMLRRCGWRLRKSPSAGVTPSR